MTASIGSFSFILLVGILMLLLAGCQPKKAPKTAAEEARVEAGAKVFYPAPETSRQIQNLLERSRAGEEPGLVLAEFNRLIADGSPLLRDEATFRKVQFMLEQQLDGADQAASEAIAGYPDYMLIPYAHFWLAKWWLKQDEAGRALVEMKKALLHERLSRELADEILELGPPVVQEAPERDAVNWLLAAAQVDAARRNNWLRIAARRTSLETLEQLHAAGALPPDMIPAYDLHVGRTYLMRGDIAAVTRISELLFAVAPESPEMEQLKGWATGEVQAATIGVLLPLTGPYASYGHDALKGIRIAMAGLDSNSYITLRIEDTASDAATAIAAYERLAEERVNMIVGPLLAETTEALLPYLKDSLPMISLTGRTDLAGLSEALFVHTLSPLAQVHVMAEYAWQQGAARMVVISDVGHGIAEGEAFAAAFEARGGEIMETLYLDGEMLDHRDELRQLRYETDDEELLAALDEDLSLFLPEMDMEIKMPVHFDAAYMALSGKQVSLLAGQLAYADILGIPLYGTSRWQDGHLLDDRGRYLSEGRFTATGSGDMSESMDDPSRNLLRFTYREAWGSGYPSELATLAYDTMRIATVMTSRLGLEEGDILTGLQDPEGFPAITGHVRFDESGAGQKQLDIFGIQGGKIVPAG